MALYRFTDTIERALRAELPSEALNFNGVFLENEIDGYRTLNVTGREALESEIDAIETKARHGARYRSRRHLPRVITVNYQLSAKNATELMEKFNKLNHILDAEEATLIFNDEPDKFFIGTRRALRPPKEGVLTTKGEIEFYCADPFKYSVKEYEVTEKDGAIKTIYNGTVPNPPKFKLAAHGNIALVELLKDTARVICGTSYDITKGQGGAGRVIFDTRTAPNGWEVMEPLYDWKTLNTYIPEMTAVCGQYDVPIPGTNDSGFWRNVYDEIEYEVTTLEYYDTTIINGEAWLTPYRRDTDFYLLSNGTLEYPSSSVQIIETVTDPDNPYNTWTETNTALPTEDQDASFSLHGGAMEYEFSLKRSNFEMDFESRIYARRTVERGAQAFTIYGTETTTTTDDNDQSTTVETTVKICGLVIQKSAIGTNRLEISVYIGDDKVDTIVMQATADNPVFGENSLRCSLMRFGGVYTLRLGNESYTYSANGTNSTLTPTHMTVYMMDYSGSPVLAQNAVRYVRFVEHSASSAKAVSNAIKSGDEVVIDCASAEITVNGVSEPGLGDIMNQWDGMELVTGENNIGITMARDTSKDPPEITMTYREAYL